MGGIVFNRQTIRARGLSLFAAPLEGETANVGEGGHARPICTIDHGEPRGCGFQGLVGLVEFEQQIGQHCPGIRIRGVDVGGLAQTRERSFVFVDALFESSGANQLGGFLCDVFQQCEPVVEGLYGSCLVFVDQVNADNAVVNMVLGRIRFDGSQVGLERTCKFFVEFLGLSDDCELQARLRIFTRHCEPDVEDISRGAHVSAQMEKLAEGVQGFDVLGFEVPGGGKQSSRRFDRIAPPGRATSREGGFQQQPIFEKAAIQTGVESARCSGFGFVPALELFADDGCARLNLLGRGVVFGAAFQQSRSAFGVNITEHPRGPQQLDRRGGRVGEFGRLREVIGSSAKISTLFAKIGGALKGGGAGAIGFDRLFGAFESPVMLAEFVQYIDENQQVRTACRGSPSITPATKDIGKAFPVFRGSI